MVDAVACALVVQKVVAPRQTEVPQERRIVFGTLCMPKTISSALDQHLAGEVTTLATCWKITRR